MDATEPKEEIADDDSRSGLQSRWDAEISAAKKNQEDFWTQGDTVVKEFLGDGEKGKRLNLFHADCITKGAQLFGNTPKVRARRRFGDAADEPGRVAGEALERLLNTDIERDEDGFQSSMDNALSDWLKPGLGCIRFRYVVETEMGEETPARVQSGPCPTCRGMKMPMPMGMRMTGPMDAGMPMDMPMPMCPTCGGVGEMEQEMAPAIPAEEVKTFEDVETDYVYWKDLLWSPCRTWSEVRWLAYAVEMSKDQLHDRYDLTAAEGDEEKGKLLVDAVPLQTRDAEKRGEDSTGSKDVWSRAKVWEIWDKEDKKVIHFVEGFTGVLDVVDDPLGLPNFFPSPKPLMANATTSKLMPKAPYLIVEDLYQEAHQLTKRIAKLVETIKVAGVYDKSNEGVQKLLDKSVENVLLPVDNWATFVEKGGISGAIAFLPLEATVAAVVQLVQQRNIVKRDLYEITGQSDIMRGQAAEKATATEQRIKARFGGTRIIADQRELARFASEGQRIRAHIIAKMFDPATIIERSNMENTPDKEFLSAAMELLKSGASQFRVEVDAESLSMTDFDAQQQEGIAIMQATAEFFKNFAPLIQSEAVGTFVLELYQQFITQFRGANRFESIIDRGIDQLKKAAATPKPPPPPPPPDPRAQAVAVKAQADVATSQMDVQGKQIDLQSKQVDFGTKMAEMRAAREDQAMMGGAPIQPGEF